MHSNDYRKAAILLYEHSGSMRHVSKVLKVSVSTVCRWLKRSVHAIWPKGRAGKITDQLIDFVRSTLTQNPSTHASRVACAFENSTGIKVSRQLISTRLNMSYKRVRKRGIPSRLDLHADRINEFKAAFVSAYDAGSLACCDESGFDHRARPIYGYAVKSKQCVLTVPYSKCKHIHYTLTQGIHMDGSTHHSFKEGSNRAVDFEGFLRERPSARQDHQRGRTTRCCCCSAMSAPPALGRSGSERASRMIASASPSPSSRTPGRTSGARRTSSTARQPNWPMPGPTPDPAATSPMSS